MHVWAYAIQIQYLRHNAFLEYKIKSQLHSIPHPYLKQHSQLSCSAWWTYICVCVRVYIYTHISTYNPAKFSQIESSFHPAIHQWLITVNNDQPYTNHMAMGPKHPTTIHNDSPRKPFFWEHRTGKPYNWGLKQGFPSSIFQSTNPAIFTASSPLTRILRLWLWQFGYLVAWANPECCWLVISPILGAISLLQMYSTAIGVLQK